MGDADAFDRVGAAIADLVRDDALLVQSIRETGFEPALGGPNFARLPSLAKLHVAYRCAEQHERGNGKRFIEAMAARMADEHGLDALPVELHGFVPKEPPAVVQFAKLTRLADAAPLNPEINKALFKIGEFAEGGALGGPQGILKHYFGLSDAVVEDLLVRSGTTAEAIKRAATYVPEQQRYWRVTTLVAALDDYYGDSSLKERAFDSFRPQRRTDAFVSNPPDVDFRPGQDRVRYPSDSPGPAPGDAGPSLPHDDSSGASAGSGGGSGGGGGGGGGGARGHGGSSNGAKPSAAATPRSGQASGSPASPSHAPPLRSEYRGSGFKSRYADFVRRNYGGGRGGSFGKMIATGRGFGGVVIGAAVSADIDVKKPKSTTFIPGADGETGFLRITFDDGTTATFKDVAADDLLLAMAVTQPDPAELKVIEDVGPSDDGIGLVGIENPVPHFDCAPGGFAHRGRRWQVILHPALDSTSLGWQLIFLDSELTGPAAITADPNSPSSQLRKLVNETRELTTWKFIDLPTRISCKGEVIALDPADAADDSAHSIFITMTGYDTSARGSESLVSFNSAVRPLIAKLVATREEFRRFNQFARVASLVRWLRANEAVPSSVPEPSDRAETPLAVVALDGTVIPAPDYTPESAERQLRMKVHLRLAKWEAAFASDLATAASRQQHAEAVREQQAKLLLLQKQSAEALTAVRKKSLSYLLSTLPPAELSIADQERWRLLDTQLRDPLSSRLLRDMLIAQRRNLLLKIPEFKQLNTAASAAAEKCKVASADLDAARTRLWDAAAIDKPQQAYLHELYAWTISQED